MARRSVWSGFKSGVSNVISNVKSALGIKSTPTYGSPILKASETSGGYVSSTGQFLGGGSSGSSGGGQVSGSASELVKSGSASELVKSGGGGSSGALTQSQVNAIQKDLTPTTAELSQATKSGLSRLQKYEATKDIDPLMKFGKDIWSGVKSSERKIREFFTPFVENIKKKAFFKDKTESEDKKGFLETTKESISNTEQKIIEKLIPSEKEKRVESENYNKKISNIENRIDEFNKKYGGKELSEEEYNKAINEQSQINTAVYLLENEQRIKQQRDETLKRVGAFEGDELTAFTLGLVKGAVSAPFELGKLGIGLVSEPTKTIEETVKGIVDIPMQFATEPFSTTGELIGSFAVQSAIFGGGIKGAKALRKVSTESKINIISPKLDSTLKTPLSKTFATDLRVFVGEEPLGLKVKLVKQSEIGLNRFRETKSIESATSKLLNDIDVNRLVLRISKKTIPKKSVQQISLERFKEAQRIESATKKALGDDFRETVDYYKGLRDVRNELGEIPYKPSKAGLKAIEKVKEAQRIESATDFLLKEANIERVITKATEVLKTEPRLIALQKFKKLEAKKPQPYKPITFDIDVSGLRNQLNRLKSGADRVIIDKNLNTRIKTSEPRFKTPSRIKKIKRSFEQPSFKYERIEDIPEEVKGEISQVQRGGQQQVLMKPEQLQKQIEKTEPIKIKILSEKEIQRLKNKQRKIERNKLKQKQRQAQRQEDLEPLLERSASIYRQRMISPLLVREAEQSMQRSSELQLQKFIQKEGQPELEKSLLKTRQETKQESVMTQAQVIKEIMKEPLLLKQIQEPIKPKIFRKSRESIFKERQKEERGYNVLIKEPKSKKYIKVTKQPIGLKEAKDTRAFFIDETTSRTGKIKPTKQKANPSGYDIPRGYAERTEKKFRAFRQRKGKRTPLTKTIIEKSPYLLDTRSEVKQINIFRKMAEVEKKKQKKINKQPVGLSFA